MGKYTSPGFTQLVNRVNAVNSARFEITRTRCSSRMPSAIASSGFKSSISSSGTIFANTADFPVRVSVCHCALVPRPVIKMSGNSALRCSGGTTGSTKQNFAR